MLLAFSMIYREEIKHQKAAFAAIFISMITFLFLKTNCVYADEIGNQEIKVMFFVFKDMSDLFIKFAYGAMVLIFAVGMVKSGLTAQAAKQFGVPVRVSGELMNILGGIVIFVVGILSYPLAKEIIKRVTSETGISTAPTTNNLSIPGIK